VIHESPCSLEPGSPACSHISFHACDVERVNSPAERLHMEAMKYQFLDNSGLGSKTKHSGAGEL
jgi:hypothetical protein